MSETVVCVCLSGLQTDRAGEGGLDPEAARFRWETSDVFRFLDAERARAFDALLDGRRIREDLGFSPKFPRLADALAAGA